MSRAHAPALPHGPIEEILDDVFVVRGTHRFAPLVDIPRTMTVLRHHGVLTLVNAVRLSREGEQRLRKLGEVRHLIKLGHHHGVDHAFYRDRFGAKLWALPEMEHEGDVRTDEELRPGRLPVDAELFRFERAQLPEAALVHRADGGLLVTCDSVQNWPDLRGCSLLGKLICGFMGFVGPSKLGPGWVKAVEPRDGVGLAPDFHRLLQHRFSHMTDGHGVPRIGDAKERLTATVRATYGQSQLALAA